MPTSTYQAGIYSIFCTANGKQYIGSSKNIHERWTTHRNSLRRNTHFCRHLQHAFNKYGKDAFVFNVVEHVIEPIISSKQLTDIEQIWIDAYWDQGLLFNVKPKAESNVGYKHSDDARTRRKGADHHSFGRTVTEETRRKISESQKGKTASDQKKAKMRKVNTQTAEAIRHEYSVGKTSHRALAKQYGVSAMVVFDVIHHLHGY
jgi:group I intron endonuclease